MITPKAIPAFAPPDRPPFDSEESASESDTEAAEVGEVSARVSTAEPADAVGSLSLSLSLLLGAVEDVMGADVVDAVAEATTAVVVCA